MAYSAIDGDISDFLDAQPELAGAFSTDDLRAYLCNEGHPMAHVVGAVIDWQQERFWPVDETWKTFGLTSAGLAAVEELRRR